MTSILQESLIREVRTGGGQLPTNLRGEYPKAAPFTAIQNDQSQEIPQKAAAISDILKIATDHPKDGFSQMVPHLDKLFKSYDPDSSETPLDLGAIWYNKGGADVKALLYLGFLSENEPALFKDAIKTIGIENFKKALQTIYNGLPTNEEAFSTEEKSKINRQLKDYLPQ